MARNTFQFDVVFPCSVSCSVWITVTGSNSVVPHVSWAPYKLAVTENLHGNCGNICLSVFVAFILHFMVGTPVSCGGGGAFWDPHGQKATSTVTRFVGIFSQSLHKLWDGGIKISHGGF